MKIDWHLDFLRVARKFIEKFFSCNIPAGLAVQIYATERAQLVYADFCSDGDFPAIKQLYLINADGTRFDILITDKPAQEFFAEQNQSGTSGGSGYGLELVENFNAEVKKLNSVEEISPPEENLRGFEKISAECDYYREAYADLDAAYKNYLSLDEKIRYQLAGIFGDAQTVQGFLIGAANEKHINDSLFQ